MHHVACSFLCVCTALSMLFYYLQTKKRRENDGGKNVANFVYGKICSGLAVMHLQKFDGGFFFISFSHRKPSFCIRIYILFDIYICKINNYGNIWCILCFMVFDGILVVVVLFCYCFLHCFIAAFICQPPRIPSNPLPFYFLYI